MSNVLVVGGSGYLGRHVVEALKTQGHEVTAPSSKELNLIDFMKEPLVGYHSLDYVEFGGNIVKGDWVPFSKFQYVVNCAGYTRFNDSELHEALNEKASPEFSIHLANQPGVKKVVHVGTAFSKGLFAHKSVGDRDNPPFYNHYTRSKAKGMYKIRDSDVVEKIQIVDPSIVVGHTQRKEKNTDSLYWFLETLKVTSEWKKVRDCYLDIVPVDWVAESIVTIVTSNLHLNYPVNLSAGNDSEKLMTVLSKMPEYLDLRLPTEVEVKALKELLPFVHSSTKFDNSALKFFGIDQPPRFTDYLHNCFSETLGDKLPVTEDLI